MTATIENFKTYVKRMKQLEEAISVLIWDLRTGAPKKGVEQRSEVIGMLSGDVFKMSVSQEMGEYLAELTQPDVLETLDDVTRASVLERKKEYDRSNKIPPQQYQDYVILTSKAEYAWQEAKANNDFESFRPHLEQIVGTLGEFIEIWGYGENKYDTLLDQFEPGMTVAKIDAIFKPLRERTVALVKAIGEREQVRRDFLKQNFPKQSQREFCDFILSQLGYDFEAGRLDESAHPFAVSLNIGDVRVTTRFRADDMQSSLFGTIHECGHAMYEQNISTNLLGTFLATGASMGIHESQSRFWENMVGRSREFWNRYYADLTARFPEQFAGVSVEEFYDAVNLVEPSLIRVDADELTYNLHIMIRYEIEKDLINGVITVADLPRIWNEKMEEYLGIVPENNGTGVLQDIHWAGGAFGYFPSYTLGNIYAAQFEAALRREIPDYQARVAAGDLTEIKSWLTDKVYRHGKSLEPAEIVQAATGEEINAEYLINYLESKFRKIYNI
ncbi:carboxypeptidase M32 [Tumebacillus permanentifrigoris]|uniref:Metal-dependent carboxypeptidase n=1 Tax=Tumebacillus permanentifrigoris TaxID=378543 RepID=A0A316DAH9_9BACL|nr:carboxypeptidase M32 [Tumebacillus permanentifrigoris]PWK13387.1 carboxypeptidase Taq [Tumebacillus permanentifrigoris]